MIEDCAKEGEEVQELINIFFLLLSVIKYQSLTLICTIKILIIWSGLIGKENYWIECSVLTTITADGTIVITKQYENTVI